MDKLLSMAQVSEITGRSVDTLRYWRKVGEGPNSFKLGRRVVYAESDLEKWIDDRRKSTSTAVMIPDDVA